MQFRWVAIITLWTFLTGPILGPPAGVPARSKERPAPAAKPDTVEKNTVPR
jgi:hypothetical protein